LEGLPELRASHHTLLYVAKRQHVASVTSATRDKRDRFARKDRTGAVEPMTGVA
jgi:hypothetical protein